jgi:hypothetical protein
MSKVTYLPGSMNEITSPNRDVNKNLDNQRPSEGSYDLAGQVIKSLDQTIYNANITTISDEYIAKVQYAKVISFDDAPTVLPGHVYAHLYSKYSGGTHSPDKKFQVLEVWAGIDYCHTAVDSPDSLLESNSELPPEGSVDRIRMSALHKFYDIMVGDINIPNPGDRVTVRYTDSNPRTSGVIISHVGSTAATAISSPAGAHLSAGASATVGSLAPSRDANMILGHHGKRKRPKEKIICIVIHESGTTTTRQLVMTLNSKKLSINWAITKGKSEMLVPSEYATWHGAPYNMNSIGVEVNHHYYRGKGEENPIPAPWHPKSKYGVPTLETLEETYQLIRRLCREYEIKLEFANLKGGKYAMGIPDWGTSKVGIIPHSAFKRSRSDGLFPCLYMILRERGLAGQKARIRAIELLRNKKKGAVIDLRPAQS